jgi:hypothetical protein
MVDRPAGAGDPARQLADLEARLSGLPRGGSGYSGGIAAGIAALPSLREGLTAAGEGTASFLNKIAPELGTRTAGLANFLGHLSPAEDVVEAFRGSGEIMEGDIIGGGSKLAGGIAASMLPGSFAQYSAVGNFLPAMFIGVGGMRRLNKAGWEADLDRARTMEYKADPSVGSKEDYTDAAKKDPVLNQNIWENTGLHKGPDNLWRHEIHTAENFKLKTFKDPQDIPDATRVKYNKGGIQRTTWSDFFSFPELEKAYPGIKNIQLDLSITRGLKNIKGSYRPSFEKSPPRITVAAAPEDLRSAVLHELQHFVQHQEGFAKGAGSENLAERLARGDQQVQKWIKDARPELSKLAEDNLKDAKHIEDRLPTVSDPKKTLADKEEIRQLRKNSEKIHETLLESKNYPFDQRLQKEQLKLLLKWVYAKHAGEVEARLVQDRMDYTPKQRFPSGGPEAISPLETPSWGRLKIPEQIVERVGETEYPEWRDFAHGGPIYASEILHMAKGGPPDPYNRELYMGIPDKETLENAQNIKRMIEEKRARELLEAEEQAKKSKPDLRNRDAAVQDADLQRQIEGGVKGGSGLTGMSKAEEAIVSNIVPAAKLAGTALKVGVPAVKAARKFLQKDTPEQPNLPGVFEDAATAASVGTGVGSLAEEARDMTSGPRPTDQGFNIDAFHGTSEPQSEVGADFDVQGDDYIRRFGGSDAKYGSFVNDIGDWFSESPDVADYFAGEMTDFQGMSAFRSRGVPQVYPVKLRLQNPAIFDTYEDLEEAYRDWQDQAGPDEDATGTEFANWLKSAGKDGIVIEKSTTDTGELRKDYVVFDSENVRSRFWKPGDKDFAHGGPIYAGEALNMANGGDVVDIGASDPNRLDMADVEYTMPHWERIKEDPIALMAYDPRNITNIPGRNPGFGTPSVRVTRRGEDVRGYYRPYGPHKGTIAIHPAFTFPKSEGFREYDKGYYTGEHSLEDYYPKDVDIKEIAQAEGLDVLIHELRHKGLYDLAFGEGSELSSDEQRMFLRRLRDHPDSPLSHEARIRLQDLKDLTHYPHGEDARTGKSLKKHLRSHPYYDQFQRQYRHIQDMERHQPRRSDWENRDAPVDTWYQTDEGRAGVDQHEEDYARAQSIALERIAKRWPGWNYEVPEDSPYRSATSTGVGITEPRLSDVLKEYYDENQEYQEQLLHEQRAREHAIRLEDNVSEKAEGGLASMAPEARGMFGEPRPMTKKPRLADHGPGANPGVASLCGAARNMNRSVVA